MEFADAIKLLNLKNFGVNSEKELKSNYRAMMRQYHPDFNDGSTEEIAKYLNEAYKILSDRLVELRELDKINKEAVVRGGEMPYKFVDGLSEIKRNKLVITLQDLITLYNNKEVYATGTLENKTITRADLGSDNMFIDFEAVIICSGRRKKYSSILKYTRGDDYEVVYEIEVDNVNNTESIDIDMCGKKLNIRKSNVSVQKIKNNRH